MSNFIKKLQDFDWASIETLKYKDEDGNPSFKGVSRKKLFCEGSPAGIEVRYFEVEPGGHTTLEKHEHTHVVIPIRGKGFALVDKEVFEINCNDVIYVPTWNWHQFRAAEDDYLGFLCMVTVERDRPTLPTQSEIDEMKKDERISAFIRTRLNN